MIPAQLLATHIDLSDELAPRSSVQQGPRYSLRDGFVHRLDRRLQSAARRRVDLPTSAKLLAATTDLSVAVAAEDDVLHLDGSRCLRLDIAFADSATFLASGNLLVAAAWPERNVLPGGWEHVDRGDNRLLVIDPHAGITVAEAPLGVSDAVVITTAHPTDGSVLLGAYGGQNFSELFVSRQPGDGLRIDSLGRDVGDAAFDPTGSLLLISPNPNSENRARVVAWPSLEEIGAIEGGSDELEGHLLGAAGFFVAPDRVLLSTMEGPPILCTSALRPLTRIELVGAPLGEEMTMVLGLEEDVFAMHARVDGVRSTSVWQVPGPEVTRPEPIGGPEF